MSSQVFYKHNITGPREAVILPILILLFTFCLCLLVEQLVLNKAANHKSTSLTALQKNSISVFLKKLKHKYKI